MKEKIYSYKNEDVEVTWDLRRCIHAEECVHGLPNVFDPKQKPWINPDAEPNPDKLAEVIERCPTGALHYHFLNQTMEEKAPEQNKLTLAKDGPLYIHGNITIKNGNDEVIKKDTRVAMCRCGLSSNKPFCDNSHIKAGFKADTSFDVERLRNVPMEGKGGDLSVKVLKNAPFIVEGNYELEGADTGAEHCSKKMSYCRCGASSTKPYCDGSHRAAGFEAD